VARGRAWSRLAAAEPQQAQQILIRAADELTSAPVYDAELRYEAMRAGQPARQLAEAFTALATRSDAPLTLAYATHVSARATGDAQRMLTAADAFAALGVNLYAAEAAAHAASAFAAEGREDSARRAAAHSRQLQHAGQGALPLTIDGVDRAATELTPREAQMVELAARGLSNPEIAERLVLSTRTVETHIYRAMRKLGVSDRHAFRPRRRDDAGARTPQPPLST
jgi:DNA-binding NarL/FixJ family response regulator